MEPLFVTNSKLRCEKLGIDPNGTPNFTMFLSDTELRAKRLKYEEILIIITGFMNKMLGLIKNTPLLILISDENGYILDMAGDQAIKNIVKQSGIKVGLGVREEEAGTNSITLALELLQPVEIVGSNHYFKFLEKSACYSVPFKSTDHNQVLGTITIMTSIDQHSPFLLPLLCTIVESIERELLLKKQNQIVIDATRNQQIVNSILRGNMDNGVIIIDNNGLVAEFNNAAEKITGIRRHSIIGKSYTGLVTLVPIIRDSILTYKNLTSDEVKFEHTNGMVNQCHMDIIHIKDGSMYNGCYIQLRDMTEKYNLLQQVIVSDKLSAIGKLAAGLAHEIRNPLTAVMGFVQLIKGNNDISKIKRYIEIIHEELLRVKNLVSDFVIVAKPSPPNKQACDVIHLISDTVTLMESQAILKDITIVRDFNPNDEIMIHVDSPQIRQVLINIIQNAIESMDNGKAITVRVNCDTVLNRCSISIIDQGIGIDDNQLKQIMNPFFTTKETGTGLGLSVSYRIIEGHGGSIDVSSRVGVGTQFVISLPCS